MTARLHDIDTERALLGAVLLDPDQRPELPPEAFSDLRHRAIWVAMLALPNGSLSVATVRAQIADPGTREALRIAEESALSADGQGELAALLSSLWTRRRTHEAARRILTAAEDDDASTAEVVELAEIAVSDLDLRPRAGAIDSAWAPLPAAWLDAALRPPPVRWLLRHPTRDGQACLPGNGDGMLPLGIVGGLVAAGGVGKTLALIGLALSVCTGRRWLDHYEIGSDAVGGRVLLLLGEESEEELHRRIWGVARALGLSIEERAVVEERLVALPLAGKHAPFVALEPDGRSQRGTRDLESLRQRLQSGGPWALVVVDPLSRFGGPLTETDNAAATRFVQELESLAASPGSPTILVAHHTAKTGRGRGVQADTEHARGSSGITDAMRWVACLTHVPGGVEFRQTKSNCSRPMDDPLLLVRDAGGALRTPTESEQFAREEGRTAAEREHQAERDAARAERAAAKGSEIEQALVQAVRDAAAPITSRRSLRELVHVGHGSEREGAISRLLAAGRLCQVEGRGGQFFLPAAPGKATPPATRTDSNQGVLR